MSTVPFDFLLPTRIVFGVDTLERLGDLAGELHGRRAMVFSDQGVVLAGHTHRGLAALAKAGLQTELFDQVHENPTTDDVAAGVAAARRFAPDLLIGLGGGSSLDCAKGVNFLYTNGGRMQDYWGVGKAQRPMLPMIAVPTTAGTGSEAQSFALISDAQSHVKMACGDKKAACRVAVLDPRLTLTQPRRVTALTGIDAVAHALETYVSNKRNPLSQMFSREAWRLLAANFGRVLAMPDDMAARGAMQLGACFAGLAIENSMLGAAHGLANPLTAHYGIAHGQAVGLMLPHVIRFNAAEVGSAYGELLQFDGGCDECPAGNADASGLAAFVTGLASQAGLETRLADCGVEESRLPTLATEATRQWTASFNPRPVDEAAMLAIYRQAF
ncbi:MAG: iron-containing alcohol dehydrogenase [Pirellulaceae bacterium]